MPNGGNGGTPPGGSSRVPAPSTAGFAAANPGPTPVTAVPAHADDHALQLAIHLTPVTANDLLLS